MDEFGAIMLVLAGGITVNTLIGLGAIYAALAYKVRVWVHPHLRGAVCGDLRLAARLISYRTGFNRAIFVVATALLFPLEGMGAVLLAVTTVGENPADRATASAVFVVLAAMLVGPMVAIPCYAWLSSRIIARSPQECWPPGTVGHDGTTRLPPPPNAL